MSPARPPFLRRLPRAERAFVLGELRTETKGGLLLLAATAVALVWANSPASDAYESLRDLHVGPAALHLHLAVEAWVSDGLLAVFFLVAGLELKRELVVGELRSPSDALVPMAAALGGMVVPALLFLAVAGSDPDLVGGWAVPTATDIAFALGVLSVLAPRVPASLRAFLLTLAVVDDLGAILVIALGYTDALRPWALVGAAALLGVFAWLQRRRVTAWYLTVPLGLAVWLLVHESGVHATVAGVALGLLVRVRRDPGEEASAAERLEHRLHPYSAYLAVPVFALVAAGVSLSEAGGLPTLVTSRLTTAIVLALVVGKAVGVLAGAYGAARFTRATLAAGLHWADVAAVAVLSGMGFTVSLLIGQLAFGSQPALHAEAKLGVLVGSLVSALVAGVMLRRRSRRR
ncbi:MAG: Na+/H+ antiporter NhaA [Actinomycetes bacterium]